MTTSSILRESVVAGYLNGKSFGEISYENNIAKGSVFNIIKAWSDAIGIPDIEELREFSTIVRKSGITIKQCAQSFRFIQILAKFGISDELDSRYLADVKTTNRVDNTYETAIKNKKSDGWKKNHTSTTKDTFYYFIETIYSYCKDQGIKPTNIVKWIQDLIDFSPLLLENSGNNKTRFDMEGDEGEELQNPARIIKISEKSEDRTSDREIQIPFISKIDEYIKEKGLEVRHQDIDHKKLQHEISKIKEQKNRLDLQITNLKTKESTCLTYLDWYTSLKQDLFSRYNIKLEEEIDSFVNVLNDFKYYDYNAHQLVKEYKQIESLRSEIKNLQGIVYSIDKTRSETLKAIEVLGIKESYLKQSLKVVDELDHAGFRIEELDQLRKTVVEIYKTNNIGYGETGKKFLKDVENQYDNKLGFERKIKELKTELEKLENQKPEYREFLRYKAIISISLEYLYKYSVTDEDIINMVSVVNAWLSGNIIFNPNLQSEKNVDKSKSIRISEYWKPFITELKNLGDINSQIIKHRSNLESIKKEIDELYSQRQKLNEQTFLSGQLLNSLSDRVSHFIDFIKQIMFSAKNFNQIFILNQPLFFICVTSGNSKDGSDKSKDNENL